MNGIDTVHKLSEIFYYVAVGIGALGALVKIWMELHRRKNEHEREKRKSERNPLSTQQKTVQPEELAKVFDELEDEQQSTDFFIINTNKQMDERCEKEMLEQKKVSAYYSPWKEKIEYIHDGDFVFLYSSGVGFIAYGKAQGEVNKTLDTPENDEEWFKPLDPLTYKQIEPPISAAEMKAGIGEGLMLRATLCRLRQETGEKMISVIKRHENM